MRLPLGTDRTESNEPSLHRVGVLVTVLTPAASGGRYESGERFDQRAGWDLHVRFGLANPANVFAHVRAGVG